MFQPVRGTHDLLPDECRRHRYVTNLSQKLAQCYGYEEIETPIFEFSEVFLRMGATSDVVTKETYTFKDRGGQEITLRPEGTAGVMRAIVSHGLAQKTPLKYFCAGAMFRYDRPQKGRYRQFNQINIELVGVAEPLADIEVLALGYHLLSELGVIKACSLEVNTLGDQESRDRYRHVLIDYLQEYREQLSPDSQNRLEHNPLRILDSKDAGDRKILEQAPCLRDYLSAASEDFFADVLKGLDSLGLRYKLNPHIVRGLDYYCHTTFEFVCSDLGAQSALLAGGRYNGLIAALGGPDLPGVGWAAGVERLASLMTHQLQKPRPLSLIPVGSLAESRAIKLAQNLRYEGFIVDLGYTGSLSKRMKKANQLNASYAVIFGEDELTRGKVAVRNLDTSSQNEIGEEELADYLRAQTKAIKCEVYEGE